MPERCPDDRPQCPADVPGQVGPTPADDLGDGLSGFVIVRLSRDLRPGKSKDLRRACDELDMGGLARLLDELGRPATRRVITSLSPAAILRLEEQAERSPWRPENSLSRYWRIDARELPGDLHELAGRVARLPEVEAAYAELVVSDPVVNAADDPLSAQQGYLDAAPTGIDARWAWTQANGEGQGIGVVDLEQGWRLAHEDYAGKAPVLLFNVNRDGTGGYVGNHGTAVLGEMVADDNTLGVVGIAPSVASARVTSHWDGTTALHVADAILGALPSMTAGDLLLLEVQRGAVLLPTETDEADHAAIRLASAQGVIVVEAAGNGGNDLDAWTDAAGRFRLRRGHADFRDSGAIVVGAAASALTNQRHARLGFSNFGARVDCHAWGENVTTCGYGDLSPMGTALDSRYTGVFNGTSSASPIVTGAALVTQSMYRGATGGRLSPGQMRAILSNPANGTAQAAMPAGAIGVMPDLRSIGQNVLGLVPDVYLRDAAGDTGVVPSGGALSTSPDVIVRPVAVANPAAAFGEGSGTENDETLGFVAEAGQDNVIYVRMRNRGASAANGVRATVYWSQVSTLVTPSTWNLIGTTTPVNVPTGNTLVVAPGLTWPAAQIPATGHYCFVAVLDHPQDPAPPIPGPTDWNGFLAMIRNTNNVTWRNFNVQDVQPDPSADPVALPFVVAGAPDEERRFDLELAVHLPEDAQLVLEVPPALAAALPAGWRELLRPAGEAYALDVPRLRGNALCGVRLPAAAAHRCRFVVTPGKGLARGIHTIAVRQFFEGLEVGRVTWALRPAAKKRRRR